MQALTLPEQKSNSKSENCYSGYLSVLQTESYQGTCTLQSGDGILPSDFVRDLSIQNVAHNLECDWEGPGLMMISLRSLRAQTPLLQISSIRTQGGLQCPIWLYDGNTFFCLWTGMAEALNIFNILFFLLPRFLNANMWLSIECLTSGSNEVREGSRCKIFGMKPKNTAPLQERLMASLRFMLQSDGLGTECLLLKVNQN